MSEGEIAFSNVCNWFKVKHLVLIDTLAQTQNMHTASEQMKPTQPTLSKMLRDIEEMFGFPLFDRLPRSIPAKELSEQVVHYARVMLNDTERFVDHVNKLRKVGHGYLKVGTVYAVTLDILPAVIGSAVADATQPDLIAQTIKTSIR